MGTQNTQHVATQPFPMLIGYQRPVGVAVGRHNRVKPVFGSPLPRKRYVFWAHRLGVYRNKRGRTPQGHHIGAQRLQQSHQQISPHCRVLIHAHTHAAQGVGSKKRT